MAVGASYDYEPYVTYVRDDAYFTHVYDDLLLEKLVTLDVKAAGVEGVSGATMTSRAVAEGAVKAAAEVQERRQAARDRPRWSRRDWAAVGLLVLAVCLWATSGL